VGGSGNEHSENSKMEGELMNILKTQDVEKIIFTLTGRLDTITAPELGDTIIPELSSTNVELDFRGLDYVSSAGLRVLLMAEKEAKAKGTNFYISNVSENIMEILDMTGFSTLLKIF
jgi:anti-anti-sigma factor